jgi:uncharacterized membrane protein
MVVAALLALAHRTPRHDATDGPRGAPTPASDFSLLLIGVGAILALTVEFVYLGDVFGTRMNTVFKLYFQTWVLWAIASAHVLARALGGLWLRRAKSAPAQWQNATRVAAVLLLVGAGAVYTPLAVVGRSVEYGGGATLDGAAHLALRNRGDLAAIEWLNQNVHDSPVILEGPGTSYTYGSRISAHTGLPTLLGWPGHERQWRGGGDLQLGREDIIDAIYTARDIEEVASFLDRYGVRFVIIGDHERARYEADGLSRLAAMLTPVFSVDGTTIYAPSWDAVSQ